MLLCSSKTYVSYNAVKRKVLSSNNNNPVKDVKIYVNRGATNYSGIIHTSVSGAFFIDGLKLPYKYLHRQLNLSSNPVFQSKYDGDPEIPLTGEIDILPYFSDNILGSEALQANYFRRKIATEKDILGLIWLSKLKIK